MIILEGPDGCGKSTLGKQLYDDKVIEELIQSPKLVVKSQLPLVSIDYAFKYKNRRVAIDRFLFSELIYGPILRKKIQFEIAEILFLASLIKNCPIIFCLPNFQFIELKNQPTEVIKNIPEIYARYQMLFNILHFMEPLSVIKYDWTKEHAYTELKGKLKRS